MSTKALILCHGPFPLTNVTINLHDLLNAVGLHQGRGDPLLHSQTYPFWCLDTDGCGAQLEEQSQAKENRWAWI